MFIIFPISPFVVAFLVGAVFGLPLQWLARLNPPLWQVVVVILAVLVIHHWLRIFWQRWCWWAGH
jgi:hypothetical protein